MIDRAELAKRLDAHAIRYANDYGYGVATDLKDAAELLRGVAQAAASPTDEDIYACCRSTLIGFRDELTEQQIKFICDQIARKSILPSTTCGDAA